MSALNIQQIGFKRAFGVATFEEKGCNQGCNPIGVEDLGAKGMKKKELPKIDVWITAAKGCNLLSVSGQALRKACRNGKYTTRMVKGNGGLQYEIKLSSLPLGAQMLYWREHSNALDIVKKRTDDGPDNLSDSARETAQARADFLKLYLHCTDKVERKQRVTRKQQFISQFNGGLYPELFGVLGTLSYKSVERWKKKWMDADQDYRVLAPRYSTGNRGRAVTSAQARILLQFALSPNRLRMKEVIRQARDMMTDQGIGCTVSDDTLLRWLNDYRRTNYDVWLFSREGRKALNDKNLPYLERDRDLIDVGDVIVADGHVLNFNVINPFTGKPKRMTLVMMFDMKSSMPVGWDIMPTENVKTIASALRRAVLFLGYRPRVFYLDNGKAFRAKYFSGTKNFKTCGLTGLWDRLGVEVAHAWAYHGQSKPIERFFGTMGELERLTPTYIGTDIAHKPAYLSRGEKWHQRMRERLVGDVALTIEDAHLAVGFWVAEYAQRVQQDGYLKGKRPIDVFRIGVEKIRSQADFYERQIERRELDFLMMEAKVRTLYRNGIRFMGAYYWSEAFYNLEKGKGKFSFTIRYDIEKLDNILVFDEQGKFVCQALATNKVHPMASRLGSDADIEALQEAIAEKRERELETTTIVNDVWKIFSTAPTQITPLKPKVSAAALPEGIATKPPVKEDVTPIEAAEPAAEKAVADDPLSRENIMKALLQPAREARAAAEAKKKIFLWKTDKKLAEGE